MNINHNKGILINFSKTQEPVIFFTKKSKGIQRPIFIDFKLLIPYLFIYNYISHYYNYKTYNLLLIHKKKKKSNVFSNKVRAFSIYTPRNPIATFY